MKYIGIDPGNKSAVSLMEDNTIIEVRSINVAHTAYKDNKILSYYTFISDIVTTFKPEVIYYEEPFIKMYQAAKSMNKKLGLIELIAQVQKINAYPINPSTVKKIITGNGRAEKDDLAKVLLGIVDNPKVIQDLIDSKKWDETDSVAIAIAGYRTGGL